MAFDLLHDRHDLRPDRRVGDALGMVAGDRIGAEARVRDHARAQLVAVVAHACLSNNSRIAPEPGSIAMIRVTAGFALSASNS